MMRAWALGALLLAFAPAIAHAAVGTCGLVPQDINFGTYSGTEITVSGSVQIMCSNGSGNNTLQVGLSYGNTSSTFPSSTANRQMQSGSNRLAYQIYTSSSRGTIWGDGSGGTTTLGVPINYVGSTVTTTVVPFAVLFAGSLPPTGNYTDAVTVSITGTTTVIHVSANAALTCTVSANALAFGAYSRTQLDGTSTLSATCSSGANYNIGLNAGVASGATVTTRKMTGPGGSLLGYSLFRDSNRSLNWGNTVGTDTQSSTGTGSAQSFTVFGRIPANAGALATGNYQDTITVTVTF